MPVSVAWANGLRTKTACADAAPTAVCRLSTKVPVADEQLAVLDAAYLCPQQRVPGMPPTLVTYRRSPPRRPPLRGRITVGAPL